MEMINRKDGSVNLVLHNLEAINNYFKATDTSVDDKNANLRYELLRHGFVFSNDNDANNHMQKIINKVLIRYPGFIRDPASCVYHGAYPGGLFDHSLMVYKYALEVSDKYNLKELPNFIACMFHDICKVGKYNLTTHIKSNGTMESIYSYNSDYAGIEHGAESLRRLLLVDGIDSNTLPEPWQFAIAYHMGVFGVSDTEMKNFSKMSEKYPEILLLHQCDMLATKIAKR